VFIIDGTNLLWAIRDWPEGPQVAGEEPLCQVLDRYFADMHQQCQIVFDGTRPADLNAFAGIRHLDIIHAGFDQEADSVIAGKVLADTAPKRLTIVSTDHEVRDAATGRKAAVLRCEEFWEQVLNHLRKKPRKKEPPQKRGGLTDSETDQWMDLFGLE
jgi:predicted RNA-binding protein with PIN domain